MQSSDLTKYLGELFGPDHDIFPPEYLTKLDKAWTDLELSCQTREQFLPTLRTIYAELLLDLESFVVEKQKSCDEMAAFLVSMQMGDLAFS